MTDTRTAPPAAPPAGDDKEWLTFDLLAVIAIVVALAALLLALFAIGLASRSIDEHRAVPDGGSSDGGAAAAVSLDEFEISPSPVEATAGASLTVTNDGTTVHDFAIEGGLATPQLAPGESAELDLGGVEAGTYAVYCQLPGHRDSGMEAELTVG